jgi:hypothetical protein
MKLPTLLRPFSIDLSGFKDTRAALKVGVNIPPIELKKGSGAGKKLTAQSINEAIIEKLCETFLPSEQP